MLMSWLHRTGIVIFQSTSPDSEDNYFHKVMDDADR